jgi:hypothetical protein
MKGMEQKPQSHPPEQRDFDFGKNPSELEAQRSVPKTAEEKKREKAEIELSDLLRKMQNEENNPHGPRWKTRGR